MYIPVLRKKDFDRVLNEILDSKENDIVGYTKYKGQVFYTKDKDLYIALDNRLGQCWVEQFNTKAELKREIGGAVEMEEREFLDQVDTYKTNIHDIMFTDKGRSYEAFMIALIMEEKDMSFNEGKQVYDFVMEHDIYNGIFDINQAIEDMDLEEREVEDYA